LSCLAFWLWLCGYYILIVVFSFRGNEEFRVGDKHD
jgi:hypothetical protein